jgi:hypothetical protein
MMETGKAAGKTDQSGGGVEINAEVWNFAIFNSGSAPL